MATRAHGKDGAIKVDGTEIKVVSWDGTFEVDDDDVTEQGTDWQIVLGGIRRGEGTFEGVYKGASPPVFEEGDYLDAEYLLAPGDGFTMATDPLDDEIGCFIKSVQYTVGVDGAVRYTGSWKSSGPVVRLRPVV
jgi:hypothetical protein